MLTLRHPFKMWLLSLSLFFALPLPLVVAPAPSFAAPSIEFRVLETAVTQAIAPQHQTLQTQIQVMLSAGETFCQTPDARTFDAVQQGWRTAMQSWAALAPINFGPIDDTNTAWNFQFWPDPINLVERKFKSRILGQNPQIRAEDLASASVAIQGFSALEYLLFDPAVGSLPQYRQRPTLCPLLLGTLSNLARSTHQLNTAWQNDYPKRLLDPQREQSRPGFQKLHVESLFSGIVMALGTIRDQKLGQALSITKGQTAVSTPGAQLNPWMLESWRSQTSLQQIEASLRFCQTLYELTPGLSTYLLTQSPPSQALDAQIRQAFKEALAQLQSQKESAFALLQRGDTQALMALYTKINHLHTLLRINYTQAAGIQFRFNAHDGD